MTHLVVQLLPDGAGEPPDDPPEDDPPEDDEAPLEPLIRAPPETGLPAVPEPGPAWAGAPAQCTQP